MSIDNCIWVPAGARNDRNTSYAKHKCGDLMPPERYTRHQVFLAHGGNVLIDEQYFFEDEADARWFWNEGYKERLNLLGDGHINHGYDRMALWVNDRFEAERSNPRN